MIGMVNVQCDTPLDYYATAPIPLSRDSSVRKRNDSESATSKHSGARRTPSWRPLFTGQLMKKSSKPKYLKDGRKATEEGDEPNKLWEELFLRSFAQKIEQEVSSPTPLEAHKNLNSELSKLKIQDKSFYRSTYSLVSPTRVENTDFDELERFEESSSDDDEPLGDEEHVDKKNHRSNSSIERPLCTMFIPFIKTIKGNKKKNSNQ
ncbi:unnamed protein product [Caenorhabditis bovis]|uniref:Uncharacterized protein n=1 Tax=Caenorhabditis bovis TaxID=2654633 RepID=A0A8S1EYD8_9PELO|nr:unnamed protein product [Caenorhabditis bovis]